MGHGRARPPTGRVPALYLRSARLAGRCDQRRTPAGRPPSGLASVALVALRRLTGSHSHELNRSSRDRLPQAALARADRLQSRRGRRVARLVESPGRTSAERRVKPFPREALLRDVPAAALAVAVFQAFPATLGAARSGESGTRLLEGTSSRAACAVASERNTRSASFTYPRSSSRLRVDGYPAPAVLKASEVRVGP